MFRVKIVDFSFSEYYSKPVLTIVRINISVKFTQFVLVKRSCQNQYVPNSFQKN